MKKAIFTGLALALSGLGNAGQAQCINLDSGNQSPFAAIHLQPATLNSANCADSASVRYSVSNNFVLRNEGDESLLIDGEVSRLELRLHKALNTKWLDGLSITVPAYRHAEGNLDDIIDDWHDFTGLPAGDRNLRPNDQLTYRYERNGQTLVNISEQQSGLGDIVLAAHKGPYNIALKLPTGDESKLTGSGGLELGASYQKPLPEAGYSGFTSGVGLTYIADDKVLNEQANDITGSFSLGAAYAIGNRVNAFITGNWQTAWYDSEIKALGSASGNIGFGLYGETAKGFWSFRLTEDVPTETAPDFGISFDYSFKL